MIGAKEFLSVLALFARQLILTRLSKKPDSGIFVKFRCSNFNYLQVQESWFHSFSTVSTEILYLYVLGELTISDANRHFSVPLWRNSTSCIRSQGFDSLVDFLLLFRFNCKREYWTKVSGILFSVLVGLGGSSSG